MAEKRKSSVTLPAERAEFERNVANTVKYLNHSFASTMQALGMRTGKCVRDSTSFAVKEVDSAYVAQVEFARLINEIERGPMCMAQKYISEANEFIAALMESKQLD